MDLPHTFIYLWVIIILSRGYLIFLIHDVARASPASTHPIIAMLLSLLARSIAADRPETLFLFPQTQTQKQTQAQSQTNPIEPNRLPSAAGRLRSPAR